VIYRRGESARAEMMRRNYCTWEGELVKRFSKEEPEGGLNVGCQLRVSDFGEGDLEGSG